ncbi:hypothetical protein D3C83_308730 [compost metagenome]
MHIEDGAHRQHEGGDRADDRPRARIDEMVGMLLIARHGSNSLRKVSRAQLRGVREAAGCSAGFCLIAR